VVVLCRCGNDKQHEKRKSDEKINTKLNGNKEKQTIRRGMKLPTSNQHQGHAIFP